MMIRLVLLTLLTSLLRPLLADDKVTLEVGRRSREVYVHLPPAYDSGRAFPLVVELHGGGGDARTEFVHSGMSAVADEKGFIVAYPQGVGKSRHGHVFGTWNAGRCCGQAMKEKVDDVGFLGALFALLEKKYRIDPRRIYLTGISNGAMMSFRLACELSDKIAAIAPVSGQGVFERCLPTRAVPTLYFHGTADPCALYNGGSDGGCWPKLLHAIFPFLPRIGPTTPRLEPVPAFFEKWRTINQALGHPVVSFAKGAVTCTGYGGKGSAKEMELCVIQGGGHTWPGGTYGPICEKPDSRLCRKYQQIVGPISHEIDASHAIWDFFSRHKID